jgi:hypothetical protein
MFDFFLQVHIGIERSGEAGFFLLQVDEYPAVPLAVDVAGNALVGFSARVGGVEGVATFVFELTLVCNLKICHG